MNTKALEVVTDRNKIEEILRNASAGSILLSTLHVNVRDNGDGTYTIIDSRQPVCDIMDLSMLRKRIIDRRDREGTIIEIKSKTEFTVSWDDGQVTICTPIFCDCKPQYWWLP